MVAKAGARAALRANQRLARALLAVLALVVGSLFALSSFWPSLPARSFAREQQTRAQPRTQSLGRISALNGASDPAQYDRLPAIERPLPADSCVPSVVNLSSLPAFPEATDASVVALYKALREKASDLPPPPEFRGDNRKLCNPAYHQSSQWGYCLPIRGLRQGSRCADSSDWSWRALVDLAASGQVMDQGSYLDGDADEEDYMDEDDDEDGYDDRDKEEEVYREYDDEEDAYRRDDGDLGDYSSTSQDDGVRSPCVYSSVLHLLLVEVFDALRAHGLQPALVFGSMLGAVRDESVIPFTEDADVGFRKNLKKKLVMKKVKDALFARGYHMFKDSIYRVCVAPFHPLAGFLFDHSVSRRRKYHVPYVDLYPMIPEDDEARWSVDRMRNDSYRIERRDFEPYSRVKVNGAEFDTLANPHAFLREEYGPDYLTPRPRT